MIQDIFPNRLDNQYVECSPQDNDVIFFFEGSSLLAKYIKEDTLTYPLYKQFIQGIKTGISKDSVDNYSFTYLLSVDDTKYFLAQRKGLNRCSRCHNKCIIKYLECKIKLGINRSSNNCII